MAEKERCIIICGSPEADTEFIKNFVNKKDFVMCADSGYKTALDAGVVPDVFVGDFDSYKGGIKDGIKVVKLNTHKDDTDSMHCAQVAVEMGFNEAVLLCATGARLDHTLANLNVLRFLSDNGVSASVESALETVNYGSVGEYTYNNMKDLTFSVIPFCCDKAEVSYIGDVEYPADKLILSSSLVIGVSNVFLSESVKIRILSGSVLIVVNKSEIVDKS